MWPVVASAVVVLICLAMFLDQVWKFGFWMTLTGYIGLLIFVGLATLFIRWDIRRRGW